MQGRRLKIAKLMGIPIYLHLSWLFVAILITWSLARGPFAELGPSTGPVGLWVVSGLGAFGLFASILLHELGHSVVAQAYGVKIRSITLWLFGGVAEMEDEPPSAKAELWIALAGPAVSLVLGLGAAVLDVFALMKGIGPAFEALLGYFAALNLIVAVFNLLPAFPLDGGRVLRAALWAWKKDIAWATTRAAQVGSAAGLGLISLGVLNALLGDLVGGIWLGVLGLFLRGAADAAVRSALLRGPYRDVLISELMDRRPVAIRAHARLGDLKNFDPGPGAGSVPVVDDEGHLVGMLTLGELQSHLDARGAGGAGDARS